LIEFVEQFQRPLVQSSTIIITELEQKFSAEIEGFHFTGNADRIETRNGITYILDYKTGQNESDYGIRFGDLDFEKRDTWKKAIGSLQLVMYVMLYSAISNILPEKTIPAFIFLGKKELDKTIEKSLFDSEEQMKEWYPKLKEIVLLLTKEIHDESIPFSPTRDIKNDCPECPFSVICGTQWTTKYNAY
jgi:ATP-dependent helicase/nuclease subunit B